MSHMIKIIGIALMLSVLSISAFAQKTNVVVIPLSTDHPPCDNPADATLACHQAFNVAALTYVSVDCSPNESDERDFRLIEKNGHVFLNEKARTDQAIETDEIRIRISHAAPSPWNRTIEVSLYIHSTQESSVLFQQVEEIDCYPSWALSPISNLLNYAGHTWEVVPRITTFAHFNRVVNGLMFTRQP